MSFRQFNISTIPLWLIVGFSVCLTFKDNYSQQLAFRNYNRTCGLPSNYILTIYQDKAGYLWFGTDRGIAKYDGKLFKIFSSANGLANNFILSIYQSQDGSMWFGHYEGGVSKIKKDGNPQLTNVKELEGKSVRSILEDKFGRLYFGHENGITIYHKNQFIHLVLQNQNQLLTLLNDGSLLYEDSLTYKKIIPTNDLRIETQTIYFPKKVNGIFRTGFGPSKAILRKNGNVCLIGMIGFVELAKVESGTAKLVNMINDISLESICEDTDGTLWIGTEYGGILRINNEKKDFLNCIVGKENNFRISASFCDYEGTLWFGTMGSGVQKLLGKHLEIFDSNNGLPVNDITTLFEDSSSRIWLGGKNGLTVIDKDKIYNFQSKLPLIKEVRCFAEDSDRNIFIGTFNPLFGPVQFQNLFGSRSLPTISIPYGIASLCAVNLKREKNIWVSTYGGGTYRIGKNISVFKTEHGIVSNMIEDIYQGNNSIWLLSRNNGVSKFCNGIFQNFTMNNLLPSNSIYSLYEEQNGNVWLGSDAGLTKISNNKAYTFSSKDGLECKYVIGIFMDKTEKNTTDKMWLITDDCLYKYSNGKILNYGNFPIIHFPGASINSVYGSKHNSTIWLATSHGAVKIDLTKITQFSPPPRIIISEAFADSMLFFVNGNYPSKRNLNLSYRTKSVSLSFAGLSFTPEEKVKYSYKLEGFENNWTQLVDEPNVHYNNLAPGEYTFLVYAYNANMVRSLNPAKISFTINHPFWMTIWFGFLISLILLGIIAIIIRHYSTKKLRMKVKVLEREKLLNEEREKTRTQIARDLHDDISSTLGSIAMYSESFKRQSLNISDDQKFVLDRISTLASESVDKMGDIIWSIDPEHDTLGNLIARMKNLTVELCDISKTEYEIRTQEPDKDFSLIDEVRRSIYLIFKEALTNIIKHAEATYIVITIEYSNGLFQMKIQDNGRGFDCNYNEAVDKFRKTKIGHGLINIRTRSKAIEAELSIISSLGNGTTITLRKRMT